MAAPWAWTLQASRLALNRLIVTRLPCTCGAQYQRTQQKSSKRFVAPPVGKDKQTWVRRVLTQRKPARITQKMLDMQQRVPVDDVWMRAYYPRPAYAFTDGVAMHRELASPEMTDNAHAFVQLQLTLDMTLKKKTKFVSDFTQTLVLPHYFDDGTVNRILAFCRTPEDRQIAEEMGAVFVGGLDLIKSIQKGEVHAEEYEYVVCTLDILSDVASVRKHLRHLFPNKHKGSLDSDMEMMMTQFSRGKTFATKKTDDATAELDITVGTLDMTSDQLKENYDHYVTALSVHRPLTLGPFITSAMMRCPPSSEAFKLVSDDLVPQSPRAKTTAGEPDQSDDEDEGEGEEMAARQ